MTSSGIIRKVDELGRIVIPVEIRKYINIKEGEILEFNVENNSIILTKKSILDNNISFIKDIACSLNFVIDGNYIITDRNIVLFSSDPSNINRVINNDLEPFFNINAEYKIVNNIIVTNKDLYLFPYYIDSVTCGFIILYDIDDINKYNKLIKFINEYINIKTSVS